VEGLKEAPTSAVHRWRARYLARLGDRPGAQRERRRAEALPPRSAFDWFLVGHDAWLANDVRRAIHCFDQALALEADLFWALFLRALGQLREHRPSEARADLTLCLRASPKFVWAYLLRGYVNGETNHPSAAEDDFHRAEQLSDDADARYVLHVNRGLLKLARGDTGGARQELTHALRVRPGGYHAHANLAQVYRQLGELARGRRGARSRHPPGAPAPGALPHARPAASPARARPKQRCATWGPPSGCPAERAPRSWPATIASAA